MSKKLTDHRTAQTVGTRELKFRHRIGRHWSIETPTKNFAVAAVVRAVGATGAFIFQPISMELKYVVH